MTSYRRILPGLTLRPSRTSCAGARKTKVRFKVSDAGDPVKGAKVEEGGKAGSSDAKGRMTLTLKSRRALTAKATHAGYSAAGKRLKLRD